MNKTGRVVQLHRRRVSMQDDPSGEEAVYLTPTLPPDNPQLDSTIEETSKVLALDDSVEVGRYVLMPSFFVKSEYIPGQYEEEYFPIEADHTGMGLLEQMGLGEIREEEEEDEPIDLHNLD